MQPADFLCKIQTGGDSLITILTQNEHLIACIKPAGISSQKDGKNGLPDILEQQTGAEYYPVHRLDLPVGGVMLYAKNSSTAAELASLIQSGKVCKEYLAVLDGECPDDSGMLEDCLFHDRTKNRTYCVKKKRAGVRDARLEYSVVQKLHTEHGILTLVRIRLLTGRTHQIRAQFSSRSLPLLGDGKYGSRNNRCSVSLWSWRITLPGMTVSAPPPDIYPWNLFREVCE